MFISAAGRLIDFNKVNNSKRPDHEADVKAVFGEKTSSQSFQKGQTRLHKRPQLVCVRTHYTQKRIRVVLL